MLLLHAQQAVILKLGQRAADSFQLQAQVGADFFPGHAQVEFVGGIAA